MVKAGSTKQYSVVPGGLFVWVIGIAAACVVVTPAPLAGQTPSHWGITGGFVPTWSVPTAFGTATELAVDDLTGIEFQVGLGRGRDDGGNWSILYTRQRVSPGARAEGFTWEQCLFETCARNGHYFVGKDVTLHGAEVQRFFVFGTVKRRAQLGMVLGAGVGQLIGTIERHDLRAILDVDPKFQFVRGYRQADFATDVPARSLFELQTWPMARIEGAASFTLAPGLKVRATAGLSTLTVYTFGVSVLFLPGAGQ